MDGRRVDVMGMCRGGGVHVHVDVVLARVLVKESARCHGLKDDMSVCIVFLAHDVHVTWSSYGPVSLESHHHGPPPFAAHARHDDHLVLGVCVLSKTKRVNKRRRSVCGT